MTSQAFKPKAYLKDGCPFSFKFWLFMVESGLADRIEVIRCNPEDPAFADIQARLAKGLGRSATFPTVELEPERYQADSDALIKHFAAAAHIDVSGLPALGFYQQTILPQVVKLHEMQQKGG